MSNKTKSDFSFSEIENKLKSKPLFTLIFVTVLMTLFFIQGLKAYLTGLYMGMYYAVFSGQPEYYPILLTLIFFFLPALTNTIGKKIEKSRFMIFSIYVITIIRLLMAFHLPFIWEVICSGVIITFYGFFMSTFLTLWVEEADDIELNQKVIIITFSIFCAFLIDYLIRTIGFSQDISLLPPGLIADYWFITQYIWLFIQIPLSFFCIYFTRLHFPRFSTKSKEVIEKKDNFSTLYSLIFIGLGMFLFLLINLFFYPNAIAQYTATSYSFNNILNIVALMIAICIILFVNVDLISNIKIIGILNGFMILSLCLFLFLGKILTYIASILISISLVIMYLNFYLLLFRLLKINFKWEKLKTISNSITIGLAFLVLFILLHAFADEWAYTFKFLKDLGPFILLLAGIIFSISTWFSIIIKSKKEEENR